MFISLTNSIFILLSIASVFGIALLKPLGLQKPNICSNDNNLHD